MSPITWLDQNTIPHPIDSFHIVNREKKKKIEETVQAERTKNTIDNIIQNKQKQIGVLEKKEKNPSHEIGQMPWISMKGFLVALEWVQEIDQTKRLFQSLLTPFI